VPSPPPAKTTKAPVSPAKPAPERTRLFFVIERGDAHKKEIALTFDDGPHPEYTPRLLDLLKQLKVKATFFVVGEKVEEAPELAKNIVQAGHEIANHSYSHPNFKTLTEPQITEEIEKNNRAIFEACGKEPLFFRPPGGNYNETVIRTLNKIGMPLALWTYNPKDFAVPPKEALEQGILQNLIGGMVVLLHSGVQPTYDMLPSLVQKLRQQGYQFVTLSEMALHTGEFQDAMRRKNLLDSQNTGLQ
jgi:peptidoglycan/xylan/chitin deacetylase (PgdA/CDA1 family)